MPSTKTNPKIRSMEIGVSSIWAVKVYPLSMADYDPIFEKIVTSIDKMCGGNWSRLEDFGTMDTLLLIRQIASDNLEFIAKTILKGDGKQELPKVIAKEIDTDQFIQLIDILWSVNFEGTLKNGKGLFEKIVKELQSMRPSTSSVPTTEATD
jgi:hypothetical protein